MRLVEMASRRRGSGRSAAPVRAPRSVRPAGWEVDRGSRVLSADGSRRTSSRGGGSSDDRSSERLRSVARRGPRSPPLRASRAEITSDSGCASSSGMVPSIISALMGGSFSRSTRVVGGAPAARSPRRSAARSCWRKSARSRLEAGAFETAPSDSEMASLSGISWCFVLASIGAGSAGDDASLGAIATGACSASACRGARSTSEECASGLGVPCVPLVFRASRSAIISR